MSHWQLETSLTFTPCDVDTFCLSVLKLLWPAKYGGGRMESMFWVFIESRLNTYVAWRRFWKGQNQYLDAFGNPTEHNSTVAVLT